MGPRLTARASKKPARLMWVRSTSTPRCPRGSWTVLAPGEAALLPALWIVQETHGWVSERAMAEVADVLDACWRVGAAVVPYNTPYVLSKAAVRALGGTLRQEMRLAGQENIHVCTVLPATMDTPFFRDAANYSGRAVTPMGPVYTAQRAAKAVVRLSVTPRREVYVGRAGRALGALSKLTPSLVERVLAYEMDRSHLSRKHAAEPTDGNVLRPSAGPASVGGGWHGGRRTAMRRAGTAVLVVGLGWGAVGRVRGRRTGSKGGGLRIS